MLLITELSADVEPVGIMGIMGNKGGVGVRFMLRDTSICIVNSHLNAHHANVKRRNQDYHDLCERLRFATPRGDVSIFEHECVLRSMRARVAYCP
jgi:phosphatidylinositol-bisphosphatase